MEGVRAIRCLGISSNHVAWEGLGITLGNPAQMFFMCHYESMANLHVWRSGLLIHTERGPRPKSIRSHKMQSWRTESRQLLPLAYDKLYEEKEERECLTTVFWQQIQITQKRQYTSLIGYKQLAKTNKHRLNYYIYTKQNITSIYCLTKTKPTAFSRVNINIC